MILNEELNLMKSLFDYKRGVVISEQENTSSTDNTNVFQTEINKVLSPTGIELSDKESNEAFYECPVEDSGDSKVDGYVNQIKSKLEGMSIPELVKQLKQVLSIKDKPIEEQVGAATMVIAGVAVPVAVVAVVAGLVAILIIAFIARLIRSKIPKVSKRSSCGRRVSLKRRMKEWFR